jgi:ParB family chromosome partitioning protein
VDGSGVREVAVDSILANPYQPRGTMDHQRLEELAASIRTHGLMQPLIVTEAKSPGMYELIAGERRWRASRLAGLKSVTVIWSWRSSRMWCAPISARWKKPMPTSS